MLLAPRWRPEKRGARSAAWQKNTAPAPAQSKNKFLTPARGNGNLAIFHSPARENSSLDFKSAIALANFRLHSHENSLGNPDPAPGRLKPTAQKRVPRFPRIQISRVIGRNDRAFHDPAFEKCKYAAQKNEPLARARSTPVRGHSFATGFVHRGAAPG